MMAAPAAIEHFLRGKIPLTRAIGVQVESMDPGGLVLTAPLEPNHNHLGTAFGGSLAALATLAGYALLWLELGDQEAHIVIRRSQLDYRHPVTGTLRAFCHRPPPSEPVSRRPAKPAFDSRSRSRKPAVSASPSQGPSRPSVDGELERPGPGFNPAEAHERRTRAAQNRK
jgi:thioesterase domain-containing protein